MADNVDITPGAGATIAADDVGGVLYQRMKPVFGGNGVASDVAPDAGMPIAQSYLELSASVTASGVCIAQTDVRAFARYSFSWTGGSGSNVIRIQFSADGTNWVDGYFVPTDGTNTTANQTTSTTPSTSTITIGTVNARYLRANCTAYTSGTSVLTLNLFATGIPDWNKRFYVVGVNAGSGADGYSNVNIGGIGTNTVVGSALSTFNGTSWDRARSATSASNTTGTGLLGTGMLGFDGTNYQRAKVDTAGNQSVRVAGSSTSAVTSVTAATSSTQLLASSATRTGATFFNDSTASLFLKLGATASTTSFTVKIAAGAYYELPQSGVVYTGVIDGIWDAVNGAARITEVS